METQGCSGDGTDCLRRRQSRHHGQPLLLRESVHRATSLIYSSRKWIRLLPGQARLCVSAARARPVRRKAAVKHLFW